MNLFTTRIPWTPTDWWMAGKADALNCTKARYDGSDYADGDELQAYINGYYEGKGLMQRTAPCGRIEPSVAYQYPYTTHLRAGVFSEVATRQIMVVLAYKPAAIIAFIVIFIVLVLDALGYV